MVAVTWIASHTRFTCARSQYDKCWPEQEGSTKAIFKYQFVFKPADEFGSALLASDDDT